MQIFQRYFENRILKSPYEADKALWEIRLYGIDLKIVDSTHSSVPELVFEELNRDELKILRLGDITDTIVDIGAHVGIVSLYLAKKFQTATIYSYEALDANYQNLLLNLELNKVQNVHAKNLAVTGDGRPYEMALATKNNTGGSTGWSECVSKVAKPYTIDSLTLDNIIQDKGDIDLLKIDCEGAEYEILQASKRLDAVTNVIGEFHLNDRLRKAGRSFEALEKVVRNSIRGRLYNKNIEMSP
jgi:FkbM family methyltransferase